MKLGYTNLIPWIPGSGKIPLPWSEVGKKNLLTSGISEQQEEKQHDFPKVTFTLDGI
jgi:hypothetical protein